MRGCLGGHRQAIGCWIVAGVALLAGVWMVAHVWDAWNPAFYVGLMLVLLSGLLLNGGTLLRRSRSLDDEYDAGYRSGYRAGRRALLVGLEGGRQRDDDGRSLRSIGGGA